MTSTGVEVGTGGVLETSLVVGSLIIVVPFKGLLLDFDFIAVR